MSRLRIAELQRRFPTAMLHHIAVLRSQVAQVTAVCSALNPLSNLRRGFAVVEYEGSVVRPDQPLAKGQRITLRRSLDVAIATIESVSPNVTNHHGTTQ
jgi:exonuclease VII large subunit